MKSSLIALLATAATVVVSVPVQGDSPIDFFANGIYVSTIDSTGKGTIQFTAAGDVAELHNWNVTLPAPLSERSTIERRRDGCLDGGTATVSRKQPILLCVGASSALMSSTPRGPRYLYVPSLLPAAYHLCNISAMANEGGDAPAHVERCHVVYLRLQRQLEAQDQHRGDLGLGQACPVRPQPSRLWPGSG